jgi:hypothetical protein
MSLVRPILELWPWRWEPYREGQLNVSDHVHNKAAEIENHTRDLVWEKLAQRKGR